MELWAATGNPGKLKEYQMLFAGFAIDLHSQAELSVFYSPEENGKTFQENARIKAKALSAVKTGKWVFAEDSGLEVEGLGGLPGIHSARYAGPRASEGENRAKLLKMMQIRSSQNRNAKFHATIILLSPEGQEYQFAAELKGQLSKQEHGQGGFGYDSIFIPETQEKTLAELGHIYKNQISHRYQAARALIEQLKILKLL